MESLTKRRKVSTVKDARQALIILLQDLEATWSRAHVRGDALPPPRMDLVDQIVDLVCQFPELGQKSYPVEVFDEKIPEEEYYRNLVYAYGTDEFDKNEQEYEEITATSCRSILYYFLKVGVPLDPIKALLELCLDKDELVRRYNSHVHIATMMFACKYSPPDVIEYFAQEYPSMVNAQSVHAATIRGREVVPLSTIEILFGDNMRPYLDPVGCILDIILHHALDEDWPERIVKRVIRFYTSTCFNAVGDHDPEITMITPAKAALLGPIFYKVTSTLHFPRVNDSEVFLNTVGHYMMDDMKCQITTLILEIPCLAALENQRQRDNFLSRFGELLQRVNSTKRVCLNVSHNESDEMVLKLFRLMNEAMWETKRLQWLELTSKVRRLSATVSFQFPRVYIGKFKKGSFLFETLRLPATSIPTPFVQNLVSECEHPILDLSTRHAERVDSASLLGQYPTLAGLEINGHTPRVAAETFHKMLLNSVDVEEDGTTTHVAPADAGQGMPLFLYPNHFEDAPIDDSCKVKRQTLTQEEQDRAKADAMKLGVIFRLLCMEPALWQGQLKPTKISKTKRLLEEKVAALEDILTTRDRKIAVLEAKLALFEAGVGQPQEKRDNS